MNANKIVAMLIRQSLFLLLFITSIESYNLDVPGHIRHEGAPGSMFGFSVTLHQEQQNKWVIVGAPNEETRNFQPGVERGGAVFRCDISDDNRCQHIHFDKNGPYINDRNEQVDTKSYQWLGATVASAGIDGPVVACAPRYVYHQHQPKRTERIEPVGTCFIAKNSFQTYQEYSPCRTMYWGYHRQGSCQAGMSAAINKEGDRLFIGAPGSWYWQGQVYSINTDATYSYRPQGKDKYGEGGQMYAYSLNNPKDRVFQTKESYSREDDSYLGYSSVTGDFTGDGVQGVAVGMPRGAGLLGKVLIFSWNLTNELNITGEQIGAYFGYSLCSVDVDGDKFDDLIIGAPMYTEPNNEGKYETGRIYIMYQTNKATVSQKFKELETRDGVTSKARFGLSLASLGDVNRDGFGDFAVGAPYDGPNNRGAVYIFHGSKTGPLEKASQVIFAEDVGTTLKTFGFSVGGGIDMDNNFYPDLVVGAYESDSVFVFRARPVAMMDATTTFESEDKLISLENKNCTVGPERKPVSCTMLTSCFKYNGLNVPGVIDIEASWVLDSKLSKSQRMFFLYDSENTRKMPIRLQRGKIECKSEKVYLAENIQDKLTPLEVEMKYNVRYSSSSVTSTLDRRERIRQSRSTLETVLDENRGTVQRDSINIMKNCGKDNICVPDLKLEVQTNDKYILGTNEFLIVEIQITNFGEDAFETYFYMTLPQGLVFNNIKYADENRNSSLLYTAPSAENQYTLKCDIGNPLPAGKSVKLKAFFKPADKAGVSPFYDFYMEANTTNAEAEGGRFDNVFKKSVMISVEPELSITGNSIPTEIHYNASEYLSFEEAKNETDIGPQVVHIYDIRNVGTSTIEEVEVFINWPALTLDKDELMYLLSQPETLGNVFCEPTQFANPKNFFINTTLENKSYLSKNQAPIRYQGSFSSSASSASYNYSSSSGTYHRYNNQDENRNDDSREVEGDASEQHKNREIERSYFDDWKLSQGSSVNSGTINRGRNTGSSGITSQVPREQGNRSSFSWDQGLSNSGSNIHISSSGSGINRGEYHIHGGSGVQTGGSSSSNTVIRGGSSGIQTGGSSSSNTVIRGGGSSNSGSGIITSGSSDTSGSSGTFVGVGSGGREYVYQEEWNSTSVNGGPAVTQFASSNKTFHTGPSGGRVLVSETSTETVITGGILHQGQGQWQRQDGSQSSVTSSSSQNIYETQSEREQREYREMYEKQRIERQRQIEERQRLIEERNRQDAEQRRIHEERIRADEERYRLERERLLQQDQARRQVSQGTTTSFGTGGYVGGARYDSRTGGAVSGSNSASTGGASFGATGGNSFGTSGGSVVGSRNGAVSGGRTQSSQSSQSSTAWEGSSSGSSVQYNQEVDQDISSLAARTHAEHSSDSSSQGGRRRMKSQQDGEPFRPELVSGATELEKAAQGGRGFVTVGLDLGVLGGRNNVDDDFRREAGSSSSSISGGRASQASGSSSYQSGSRVGATSSYGSSSSKQFTNDDEYEEEYVENDDENSQAGASGGRGGGGTAYNTQSSYTSSYYNKNSRGSSDPQFQHYPRVRRDLSEGKSLCESAHCVNLRCVVGPLEKNTGALIALRTRLVAHTLAKIGGESEVRLSTMAIGKITKLPYVGTAVNETLKGHEIFITAIPDPIPKPDVIPLWIFILAACAGALILLLLIYLLYKCGFFKRNRPTGSPHERQPLNRNGNYHGDEHL